MISKYLKVIFNRHPPLPKYTQMWDIKQVLDYYANFSDNEELEFKYTAKKLAMLFLILGARRKQTLLPLILITFLLQIIKLLFYQIRR